jgi:hypothetical protein
MNPRGIDDRRAARINLRRRRAANALKLKSESATQPAGGGEVHDGLS